LRSLGKNFALEQVKGFRVAEKARDADEAVRVEGIQFFVVIVQEPGVILDHVVLVQHLRRVMRRWTVVAL